MKIDYESLIAALEDHSGDAVYHFNKKTGEVLRLSEMYSDESEREEYYNQVEGDDWIVIDPMPSREGFRIMEDFVEQLPDGEDKRFLDRTLGMKKPFANFKIALHSLPEIRQAWFAFRDARMNDLARQWLVDEGIAVD